jgi:hypothetical protein
METKEEIINDIVNLIKELSKESCDCCGEKQAITEQIILQAIIWGSNNFYEGLGILENCKNEWKDIIEEDVDNLLTTETE